ncbi:MAG TPA: phospholipid carrier-dependent glycosyltransferase [Spirochaetia bacterium]|nr:phospholipid carrier-dependent glycosyltransferase [Spirochaetia bacterium]
MRNPTKTRLQPTLALVLVALASLVIHFWDFGHPASLVFDEVHFGKFVSAYQTGEYYFDIHPPLGKLLIAAFAQPFHPAAITTQLSIDTPFEGTGYLALRFLPTLAGTLIPLVLALILLELGLDGIAALFGGLLACLDTALLVQTRSIFLDGFLLLFLLGSLAAYLRHRKTGSSIALVGCALLAGAAVSIKWTGLTALAVPLVWEAADALKARTARGLGRWVLRAALVVGTALVLYFASFAVHFALLPKSGPGDAFMSPAFQKTLVGSPWQTNPQVEGENVLQKFLELNSRMYTSNRDLTATHPYSSPWYTWPVEVRPIYYWNQADSRIYLVGNPILWWGSTLAVAVLAALFFLQRRRHGPTTTLLFGAWALNWLPFIFIGRVMFLYHYLAAFTFALLLLVVLLAETRRRILWLTLVTVAALGLFVWFAPLAYGWPLDPAALKLRQWFPTWI